VEGECGSIVCLVNQKKATIDKKGQRAPNDRERVVLIALKGQSIGSNK
jgi:hypothetical protein